MSESLKEYYMLSLTIANCIISTGSFHKIHVGLQQEAFPRNLNYSMNSV